MVWHLVVKVTAIDRPIPRQNERQSLSQKLLSCSRAALDTDPSPVLYVFMSMIWFFYPRASSGTLSQESKCGTPVTASSSSPTCISLPCMLLACVRVHTDKSTVESTNSLRLGTFLYAWVFTSGHSIYAYSLKGHFTITIHFCFFWWTVAHTGCNIKTGICTNVFCLCLWSEVNMLCWQTWILCGWVATNGCLCCEFFGLKVNRCNARPWQKPPRVSMYLS